MPKLSPRERAWRARNPDLAKRFDKLPAGAKANIRTANWGRGTANIVRQADVYRRQSEAARSQERRDRIKPGGSWGYLKARTPQPLKYRVWFEDEWGNIRAHEDYRRPPGNIIGQWRYEDSQSTARAPYLIVVAVTVK